MSEIALRRPGPGSVLASQIRYQLTLLMATRGPSRRA